MTQVRGGALCSTCSSRGAAFFVDGKMLISEAACRSIIRHCGSSFEILFDFIDGLDRLADVVRESRDAMDQDLLISIESLDLVTEEIKRNHLQVLIRQWLSHPPSQRTNISSKLCSRLVNLGGGTFIEQVSGLLAYDMTLLTRYRESIETRVRNHQTRVDSSSSNILTRRYQNRFRSRGFARGGSFETRMSRSSDSNSDSSKQESRREPSRELSLSLTSDLISTVFAADVVMVPAQVDSSYLSFFGTNGSTASSSAQVANLTQLFP